MKHRLIRAAATLLGTLSIIALASCGAAASPSSTPSTTAPPTSPSTPNQYRGRGPGASGTLTRIDSNTLTLTTSQGTVTVNIDSNTTIQKTITGALPDLQEGKSLFVMGNPDASGNISATSIQIQPQGWSSPSAPPAGNRVPSNHSGTRNPEQRQGAMGTLSKIDGNILTLTTSQGTATVSVDPDTTIQETVTGSISDLQEGQSLSVIGSRDANGNISATSIHIQPPGQNAPPGAPAGAQ
ncbi:MAG: DUF5666 domain-containing protein [Dehalococcoidia bacterium]